MASVLTLILRYPPDAVRFTHLITYVDGPPWLRIATFARALGRLGWHLVVTRPDVMHVHMSQRASVSRGLMLTAAARRAGVPVVLHAHGSEFERYLAALPASRKERVRSGIQRAASVIVLSRSWERVFRDDVGVAENRIHVLPNPVVLPSALPQKGSAATFRVLTLGRLGRRKGSFDLLEALARLPVDIRSRMRVVLAGDGAVAEVRRASVQLGVADVVELPGWVDETTRDTLLDAAHAFVLPSYDEGLPMALLEAMARALPVVATPVGGIPELVTHDVDGLLIPPGDPVALAGALASLSRSPELRDRLGNAARARVQPLGVAAYRERLAAIYRHVVQVDRG